jgi:leucyl/phenylalanyl-tRNA--protein transferase
VVFAGLAGADAHGKAMVGGDLEPGTLLDAYRSGLFPMRQSSGELAWWSPDPRAIITPNALRITKSLRRARRRYGTRVDTAFAAMLDGCADRGKDEYAWITPEIRAAYMRLHELGWAHSVESWTIPAEGESPMLVGGLYGVAIGGLFSGESMFHRQRDASKVALAALVDLLCDDGRGGAERIIDVQWITPHMASLGAVEIRREAYLARLEGALALPLPTAFSAPPRHRH